MEWKWTPTTGIGSPMCAASEGVKLRLCRVCCRGVCSDICVSDAPVSTSIVRRVLLLILTVISKGVTLDLEHQEPRGNYSHLEREGLACVFGVK